MNLIQKFTSRISVSLVIAAILLVALSGTTFTSCTGDDVRWVPGELLGAPRSAVSSAVDAALRPGRSPGGLLGAGILTEPLHGLLPAPPTNGCAYGYYPY